MEDFRTKVQNIAPTANNVLIFFANLKAFRFLKEAKNSIVYTILQLNVIITFITIIRIKRDFLKHKTVKTNDKTRRFGVVMTPLSRKIWMRSCVQITAFKAILARRINIRGCEDYKNTFARIQSDCTLRFGFKALIKSILYLSFWYNSVGHSIYINTPSPFQVFLLIR